VPLPESDGPRVQRHGLSHWRLAKGVQQEVRRSLPNGAQSRIAAARALIAGPAQTNFPIAFLIHDPLMIPAML